MFKLPKKCSICKKIATWQCQAEHRLIFGGKIKHANFLCGAGSGVALIALQPPKSPRPPPPLSSNKEIKYNTVLTMTTPNELELFTLASEMRVKDAKNKSHILQKVSNQQTLTGKCIMARKYLTPQSTDLEIICKNDLKIGPPINETSGDGYKNGINYEIKGSVHAIKSRINFVQIRPDHNVDYYILIAYNMYENVTIGKAHIFKVPSKNLYKLIVRYGGYAHGTCSKLGQITIDNVKGRNCEYALRCDPNATKGKSFELWNEFIKYEVEYNPDNF